MGKKINSIFKERKFKDSLSKELLEAVKKFDLNKSDFISIIKGMKMDINEDIKFPLKKNSSYIVIELQLLLVIYQ